MPKALAPQLLEVGCGTGGNLGLLQRFGAVRTLLFPLVVAARFAKKALRRDTADDEMPGPLVNGALRRIFSLERRLVGRVPIPIGSSLYLVAE